MTVAALISYHNHIVFSFSIVSALQLSAFSGIVLLGKDVLVGAQ